MMAEARESGCRSLAPGAPSPVDRVPGSRVLVLSMADVAILVDHPARPRKAPRARSGVRTYCRVPGYSSIGDQFRRLDFFAIALSQPPVRAGWDVENERRLH